MCVTGPESILIIHNVVATRISLNHWLNLT